MTERGKKRVTRGERRLQIGPSSLQWQGGTLKIDVDEIGAPIPRRIRGTIRVTPSAFIGRSFVLDGAGNHVWQPIAPMAQIEVVLEQPDLRWSGSGYLDSNFGFEPLEDGFREWTWSRAHLERDAVVLYDAMRRDGTQASLALRFDADGQVAPETSPPRAVLPQTGWRIARQTRADAGSVVGIRKTLEDTPFYARTLLDTTLYGKNALAFHESLSLDRVKSPIVRAMLPFRMPRRFG
jgi:carotenoid 1,2-hydratase